MITKLSILLQSVVQKLIVLPYSWLLNIITFKLSSITKM